MADLFTPKRDLIDTSLQNTPLPQATSTVEKSKFRPSKACNLLKYNEMDKIPSNRFSSGSTSSQQSAANSSLGILQVEHLEDIGHCVQEDNAKNDPFKKPLPKLSINANLEAQRHLALRALERSSMGSKNLVKTSKQQDASINLPSYLLQANSLQNTPIRKNTNIDGGVTMESDITGSLCASLTSESNEFSDSQTDKDFSARSSLATNRSESRQELEKMETFQEQIKEMKKQIQMLTESYIKSQPELNNDDEDESNLNANSFDTEDLSFVPAELAQEKLKRDEVSWMRERGLPVPTVDISRISAEFSEFARQQREKSIGEFFSEKCPRLSEIQMVEDVTIDKSPKRLIDSFESTGLENTVVSEKSSLATSENASIKAESTAASVLSLTSIARTLEEMSNESPGKIINMMKQKCKKVENATYTKQKHLQFSTSNKENNESSLSKTAQIMHNNSTQVLKDSSNVSQKLHKFHSSTKTDLPSCVTPKSVTPDLNTEYSPRSGDYISRTLSELNLSDLSEESTITKDFDVNSWLIVKADPLKICTQILTQAKLELLSKCNRWILVEVNFKEIQLKNGPAIESSEGILSYNIPGTTILVEPDKKVNFEFEITTLISADINFIMNLTLIDMVTKDSCNMRYALHIISISPKISLSVEDEVDFELIGEKSNKEMIAQISNDSDVEIPIILSIEQEFVVFFLTNIDDTDYKWKLNLILRPHEKRDFKMVMIGPEINDVNRLFHEFKCKFFVNVGTRNSYRLLKEVEIFGRVGVMNLEFMNTNENQPIKIYPSGTQLLTVKNIGVIKMQLNVSLLNEMFKDCHENIFHIEPLKFILLPGQEENLSISFNRKPVVVSRILLLKEKYGRSFKYPLQGLTTQEKTNRSKSPSNRSKSPLWCFRSQSSPSEMHVRCSSATSDDSNRSASAASSVSSTNEMKRQLTYNKNEKLPIEATKIEMIWGCCKVGKSTSNEIVIRNRSNNRFKFIAEIKESAFKFQNNAESTQNMNVVLQGNESRTLTVIFTPNRVGAIRGTIQFSSSVGSQTKNVRLYGYGGHTKIDLMGVSKDTSDRIWFMLGYYDTENSVMESSFLVRNTGVTPGFIYLKPTHTSLLSTDDPDLNISPKNLVILPGETKKIYISFDPRRNFKKMFENKDVCQIGTVNIYLGPEPTRFRIRNLLNRLKLNGDKSQFKNLDECLNIDYEDEKIPADISICRKESPGAINSLACDVETRILNVVVEKNFENSRLMAADIDETCIYQSLCVDQTTIMENTLMPSTQNVRRFSHNKCFVEPETLNFVKPSKVHNTFVIVSQHSRPMQYQILCKCPNLQVCPMEGIISASGSSTVSVILGTDRSQVVAGTIMVYVENEVFTINVKIN
ncbi:uncharacterized protein LOC123293676 isoform X2 [Chrysoperla carnea]|uniref:uncharacterized protein LOC123293676 isoform X2 n=1 Tax=Chrysoperla carnea TaxID=189513 RepID=UPI001D07A3F0|nr:uncharacterized protein LOC123293676 isoform X2 [Chrysoperla carnea]